MTLSSCLVLSCLVLSCLVLSFETTCPDDLAMSKFGIEQCVQVIHDWMVLNGLKLNQEKTQSLLINARFRHRPSLKSIHAIDE